MRQCIANRKCEGIPWKGGRCKRHWHEYQNKVILPPAVTKADLKSILLREQGFKCANPCCGAELLNWSEAHLDHDHNCCGAGKCCVRCTRGLLCQGCNLGLGAFSDDVDRLKGAVEYLESFKKHRKPLAIIRRDKLRRRK